MKFREEKDKHWRRFKKGQISREKYEELSLGIWEKHLAEKHLEDGSLDIFKKLIHEAKIRYAEAKDNYYLGRISIKEYIHKRGLRRGEGVGWYDHKLVELGLGTQLLPTDKREEFSWRSLKIERKLMPDSCIDPNSNKICAPENEKAAAETMLLFLELIDYYNQNYVPSLKDNWRIRDPAWVQLEKEKEAYEKPYSNVRVTDKEREQFERMRDGRKRNGKRD